MKLKKIHILLMMLCLNLSFYTVFAQDQEIQQNVINEKIDFVGGDNLKKLSDIDKLVDLLDTLLNEAQRTNLLNDFDIKEIQELSNNLKNEDAPSLSKVETIYNKLNSLKDNLIQGDGFRTIEKEFDEIQNLFNELLSSQTTRFVSTINSDSQHSLRLKLLTTLGVVVFTTVAGLTYYKKDAKSNKKDGKGIFTTKSSGNKKNTKNNPLDPSDKTNFGNQSNFGNNVLNKDDELNNDETDDNRFANSLNRIGNDNNSAVFDFDEQRTLNSRNDFNKSNEPHTQTELQGKEGVLGNETNENEDLTVNSLENNKNEAAIANEPHTQTEPQGKESVLGNETNENEDLTGNLLNRDENYNNNFYNEASESSTSIESIDSDAHFLSNSDNESTVSNSSQASDSLSQGSDSSRSSSSRKSRMRKLRNREGYDLRKRPTSKSPKARFDLDKKRKRSNSV
ncbi:hypothetical protein GF322_02385 [Candidatus Dependentiae bacterium]|nr:hypothetical protein [Candidatus Dependentiae bacterium]